MHCSLLVLFVVVSFQFIQFSNAACKPAATTTTTTTTVPPPPACSLCGNLPLVPPPQGINTQNTPGQVTQTVNAAGCKQYTVTCYAYSTRFIVIGANNQFIPLSSAAPGQKTALLACNSQGQIEGKNANNGSPLVVTSVYCARSTY